MREFGVNIKSQNKFHAVAEKLCFAGNKPPQLLNPETRQDCVNVCKVIKNHPKVVV